MFSLLSRIKRGDRIKGYSFNIFGGKGSGHHGHGGLDDVHGGSTPGSGGVTNEYGSVKTKKAVKRNESVISNMIKDVPVSHLEGLHIVWNDPFMVSETKDDAKELGRKIEISGSYPEEGPVELFVEPFLKGSDLTSAQTKRLKYVFLHEIGHAVHERVGREKRKEYAIIARKRGKGVWQEDTTTKDMPDWDRDMDDEDFAEAYSDYIGSGGRDSLKKNSMEKYRFIKKVVENA